MNYSPGLSQAHARAGEKSFQLFFQKLRLVRDDIFFKRAGCTIDELGSGRS